MEKKKSNYRILILGAIGSGKTTLAKIISKKKRIKYYSLDNLIYKKLWTIRNNPELRDKKLKRITKSKKWILEGVNIKDWIIPAVKKADNIIILNLARPILIKRIIFRYIKDKFNKRNKKIGSLKDMLNLIRYSYLYKNNGLRVHLRMIKKYKKKYFFITNKKEIDSLLHLL